jgi:hypothetical protein
MPTKKQTKKADEKSERRDNGRANNGTMARTERGNNNAGKNIASFRQMAMH